MDHQFWHDRWEAGQLRFHEGDANRHLVRHFDGTGVAPGGRVFVPLCGKTRDIGWLQSRGCAVVGAELSALAVEQLFGELGVAPKIERQGGLDVWRTRGVTIFVGDVFAVGREALGSIDLVYDRAALIALPEGMRARYTRHLTDVSGNAPQLLITVEYDQTIMAGPPFCVREAEVRAHYEAQFDVVALDAKPVPGKLKGRVEACEHVWALKPW